MLPVRRALLSVSDKTGLAELAQGLHELGVELVSTGGTARFLREAGVPVVPVSDVTGFPEILDGRVKTLHPAIHGGILADRARGSHLAQLKEHGLIPIDMVVVNLYPFERTASDAEASRTEIVEMIDIGGPTLVRAAAKNHGGLAVVVDPEDYEGILGHLQGEDASLPEDLRRRLAAKAFRHTRDYDAAIAAWFATEEIAEDETGEAEDATVFPRHLAIHLERELLPRYGENPHQGAAVYRTAGGPGLLGGVEQLQGKELSWNNVLDADAARRMAAAFDEPAVVIVKHNNPCGIGRGETLAEAFERALASDPVSAFGSIIALNRPADGDLAKAVGKLFVEVFIAPDYDEAFRKRFARKKNLRLLQSPPFTGGGGPLENLDLRSVSGGFLVQELDLEADDPGSWKCPTKRQPTEEELRALDFAWRVCRQVKSNAIVITGEDGTVGIGAGQMSRVDSCRLAIDKAREAKLEIKGRAAASDAFFPFRDGLDVLAEAGVACVVQPGGSKRDKEVIAAADEHGLAMMLTGRRHFRH